MMTRRERLQRALRLQEVDRLPFWVKIFGASYLDFQPERYRAMGELALADYLELDHITWGPSPVVCSNDRVQTHTERRNGRRITTIATPERTLRSVERFDGGGSHREDSPGARTPQAHDPNRTGNGGLRRWASRG